MGFRVLLQLSERRRKVLVLLGQKINVGPGPQQLVSRVKVGVLLLLQLELVIIGGGAKVVLEGLDILTKDGRLVVIGAGGSLLVQLELVGLVGGAKFVLEARDLLVEGGRLVGEGRNLLAEGGTILL